MTKTVSKRIISLLSAVALVSPLAASATVAENQQARTDSRQANVEERQTDRAAKVADAKDNRQQAFCSRFAETADKIAANMAERRGKFEARQGNHSDQVMGSRDTRDGKLEDTRSAGDEKRSKMYAALEARAKTDAEKAAVATFKETAEKAIDTRRTAIDADIDAFRQGVDTAVASRKDDMQKAANTFQSAVNAAVAKAKSDCDSGVDPQTIHQTFQASLAAARQSLKNDRAAVEKVNTQVKALAETKRVAIQKAFDTFKATMESARAELKKAFGEKTTP